MRNCSKVDPQKREEAKREPDVLQIVVFANRNRLESKEPTCPKPKDTSSELWGFPRCEHHLLRASEGLDPRCFGSGSDTGTELCLLRAFEGLDPRRFGGCSGGFLVASFTCCEHLKGRTLAVSEEERRGCCCIFLDEGKEPRPRPLRSLPRRPPRPRPRRPREESRGDERRREETRGDERRR
jgi:hypothetical protein